RLNDDVSKNSGASKIKKYPKIYLGDGDRNLSIKTHLNNIWESDHFIENDIEYRNFGANQPLAKKLCNIEYELSCINKAKLARNKSEIETSSSGSDSQSTGSDWYDVDPSLSYQKTS
ncbi:16881_t:CDS:1, partial [Cetraspora pellucida]